MILLELSGKAASADQIVDDFEGVFNWSGFGGIMPTVEQTTDFSNGGSSSMRIITGEPFNDGFGVLATQTLNSAVNADGFSSISYWFRSRDEDSIRTIAIQLIDANNNFLLQTSDTQLTLADAFNTWVQVNIPLERTTAFEGSIDFDFTNIVIIDIILLRNGASSDSRTIIIDDIELIDQPSKPLVTGLIDNFSPATQYNLSNINDMGGFTDDDGTMGFGNTNDRIDTDGILSLTWDNDTDFWFTVFSDNGADISQNSHIQFRTKGSIEGEQFTAVLRNSGNFTSELVIPNTILQTDFVTINLALSDFTPPPTLSSMKSLSLTFPDAPSGNIEIDQIVLSPHRRPSTILITPLTSTSIANGHAIPLKIDLFDENEIPLVDFTSDIQLTVTNGSVDPSSISGFNEAEGSLTGDFIISSVIGPQTITISDPLVNVSSELEIVLSEGRDQEISGFIFTDLDEDGIQDFDELGFDGIVLNLYSPGSDGALGGTDDSLETSTTTANNGLYEFTNLIAGEYFVEIELPNNTTLSPKDIGDDDSDDSDFDPTTRRTDVVATGEGVGNIDAGLIFAPGTVKPFRKISSTEGNFEGQLENCDVFGSAVASLGDLDGDGIGDIAVGAEHNISVADCTEGLPGSGGVWILFLNHDGTVKDSTKIDSSIESLLGLLDDGDNFGRSVTNLGDLDRDGNVDIAVGAPLDDDSGIDKGAVWILFLNPDGTVKAHQKIVIDLSSEFGGLFNNNQFGGAVSNIGDLDDDGTIDIAVEVAGASLLRGGIGILFLNANGTVKAISDSLISVQGHLRYSMTPLGDLNGDGIEDIAVGATGGFDLVVVEGDIATFVEKPPVVNIIYLQRDGTVLDRFTIDSPNRPFLIDIIDGMGVFEEPKETFGASIANVGDIYGDGVTDVIVGSPTVRSRSIPDAVRPEAIWIINLIKLESETGTEIVSSSIQEIATGTPDSYGVSLANLGDLDRNGTLEIAVGDYLDDDGGLNHGAISILSLNIVPSASIAGFVWNDGNGDGIQGEEELGLEGIEVKLFRVGVEGTAGGGGNDSLIDTKITENDGIYSFTDLIVGDYYLEFIPPDSPFGFHFSPTNQGDDDTLDSNVDSATGRTAIFALDFEQEVLHFDSGLIRNQVSHIENRSETVAEEQSHRFDLSDTVTNPDNDIQIFIITVDPEHGALDLTNLPEVIYTPEAGYIGPDRFVFKVNDGLADSNETVVNLSVQPVFAFTKPDGSEETFTRDFTFNFEWDILSDDGNLTFDIFLFENNDIANPGRNFILAEDITNNFPTNRGTIITNDVVPEGIWLPAAILRTEPYQNRIYFSKNDMIISTANTTTIEASIISTSVNYGESITVQAVISSSIPSPLNARTILELSGPNGVPSDLPFAFSSESGELSIDYAPPDAGEWQVVVFWRGNAAFEENRSELLTFSVVKSESVINFLDLPQTHVIGNNLDLKGTVQIDNENPGGISLQDLPVTITLTHPPGSQTAQNGESNTSFFADIHTVDEQGSFEFSIPGQVVDIDGNWQVSANFAGNDNLIADNTLDHEFQVRAKKGYAILCQGIADDNDFTGRDQHAITLATVQDRLLKAGFEQNDIKLITTGTLNPKQALQEAIEIWALEKIIESPAELYVVFVGHGEPNLFHLHPDSLHPAELDEMVSNLELSLLESRSVEVDSEEKIILIFGHSFSGSFIPDLSKAGRILLTASASNERSIRGPADIGERQGDYFVYLLFQELSQGRSLFTSFTNSRDVIRAVSEGFLLDIETLDPQFPQESGQHPLLDDNGDGLGSFIVSNSVGDGQLANDIFLSSPLNSVDVLEIARTNPTRFLNPDDPPPEGLNKLWAEVDENPENVATIFMDIRKPLRLQIQESAISMQAGLIFFRQNNLLIDPTRTTSNRIHYQWPLEAAETNEDALFTESGLHKVFFYALSDEEANSQLSNPVANLVYRGNGTFLPTPFDLLTPIDGAEVDFSENSENGDDTSGLFRWGESISPAGGIQYVFRLWNDEFRENDEDDTDLDLVLESPPLAVNQFLVLPNPEIRGDLWWDVVAIDSTGNHRISNEIRNVTFNANTGGGLPGFIFGRLLDNVSGDLILNGHVVINGIIEVEAVDGFFTTALSRGTHTVQAFAENYINSELIQINLNSGAAIEHNFRLQPITVMPTRTLIIDSQLGGEVLGNPQGAGEYDEGTQAQWSVTSPWPSEDGLNGVRFIATGTTSGTELMNSDVTIVVSWTKQVFLEIVSEVEELGPIGNPEGAGWYEVGTSAEWSVDSPVVEIENQKRYVAFQDIGTVTIGETPPEPVIIDWRLQWFLTIFQVGEGFVEPPSGWYDDGDLAIIAAFETDAFVFSHWDGDIEPEDPFFFELFLFMDHPREVTAIFERFDGLEPATVQFLSRFSFVQDNPGTHTVSVSLSIPDGGSLFSEEIVEVHDFFRVVPATVLITPRFRLTQ